MIWQALDKHGFPITSVMADDEEGARRRIVQALYCRPGRHGYALEWERAGRPVQPEPETPGRS